MKVREECKGNQSEKRLGEFWRGEERRGEERRGEERRREEMNENKYRQTRRIVKIRKEKNRSDQTKNMRGRGIRKWNGTNMNMIIRRCRKRK